MLGLEIYINSNFFYVDFKEKVTKEAIHAVVEKPKENLGKVRQWMAHCLTSIFNPISTTSSTSFASSTPKHAHILEKRVSPT